MGTRNLTIVKLDGKVKVAQYCQWDGYPAGQGTIIVNFLQNKLNLRKLKSKVAKLKFISQEEVSKLWEEVGADKNSDLVSFDLSDKFKEKYPYLHRDVGGNILEIIQDGTYQLTKYGKNLKSETVNVSGIEVHGLVNSLSFLKDSLFCEYAYELDLDKKTVKVYTGFNKLLNGKYGKCKVFKTYTFKDFTVNAMKDLEKELEQRRNEE